MGPHSHEFFTSNYLFMYFATTNSPVRFHPSINLWSLSVKDKQFYAFLHDHSFSSLEVSQFSPLMLKVVEPGYPCLIVTAEHTSSEFVKQSRKYHKVRPIISTISQI